MSAPAGQGVEELLRAAFAKLQEVWQEPEEAPEYEFFDFELDDVDPDYRTVYADVDEEGDGYVLSGKQLLKIFNSTNFNDSGSLRYLYRYIENSGALEQLKEMGLENGDTIRIEDFEFEYYDEDYDF